MKKRSTSLALAIACLALPALVPALAEESAAPAQDGVTAQASTIVESHVAAATGLFGAEAVSETTLQANAGREDTNQISQADLKAGVADNSVGDNSVTGNAQIDGNAFQNMSGLSILNVNTGNNVAINAAMNVNISISPAQ